MTNTNIRTKQHKKTLIRFDMTKNNYCVYVHANKMNGKRYVGVAKNLKQRWASGYDSCPFFYKAIQKYGWDGFTHYVLFDGLSLEEADEIEREYIQKYKTQDRKYGYNILPGGHGGGMLGKHHTEETKQKMREKHEGRKFTERHKANLSKSHLGKKSHCKPVVCLDTGVIYESGRMAERITGTRSKGISQCCLNKQETCNGLRWAFVK